MQSSVVDRALSQWQVLAILLLTALWPVWAWYYARISDGSDEPWGVVALITVVVFLCVKGKAPELSSLQQTALAAVLLVYILIFPFAPPIIRGILAMLACALMASASIASSSLHIAILGLLILSLPLIASLQYYLGFPVRLVTTKLAAQLIGLTGQLAEAQGTTLLWRGELVSVDAPCSGIRMLWTGLYMNFTLACFRNSGAIETWLCYSASVLFIFIGNLLRTTLLFYSETHLIELPAWGHTGIGVFAFLLVALAITATHTFFSKRNQHALSRNE